MTILAEIKALLNEYAKTKGKYSVYDERDDINWKDHRELALEFGDLIYHPFKNERPSASQDPSDEYHRLRRLRTFGKSIVRTGLNFRTIVIEPKRLVWVAFDKPSFEKLLSKLENLNTFLTTLLDSHSIKRMQDSVQTSYLEILQIRNDIESLKTLVQALGPSTPSSTSIRDAHTSSMPETVSAETQVELKIKNYLKQLAEIKIQYSTMDHGDSSIASSNANQAVKSLDLNDFGPEDFDCDIQRRTEATYRGRGVWLEWKVTPFKNCSTQEAKKLEDRIALLTNLLRYEKPDGFRAPSCLGYVKDEEDDSMANYAFVFQKPLEAATELDLFSLHDLFQMSAKPSLSSRIRLCSVLARSLSSFHAVNWLHKGLLGDHILFFSTSLAHVNLSEPYVSGFELSRPSEIEQMSEKPPFNPLKEIYRHPNIQYGASKGNYRKSHDIYSLGVLFLEIAFWKPIQYVIGVKDIGKARPFQLEVVQSRLLGRSFDGNATVPSISAGDVPCLDKVASKCGDGFRNIVEICLTMDEEEELLYPWEPEFSVAVRLQTSMENVVRKLEQLAEAMQ